MPLRLLISELREKTPSGAGRNSHLSAPDAMGRVYRRLHRESSEILPKRTIRRKDEFILKLIRIR